MVSEYGYIVRVQNKHGDFWLGQRVYLTYDDALTVKHNVQDTKRYIRVYIVPANAEQYEEQL